MTSPATVPIPIQTAARVCADQACAMTCPIAQAGQLCPTLTEFFEGR